MGPHPPLKRRAAVLRRRECLAATLGAGLAACRPSGRWARGASAAGDAEAADESRPFAGGWVGADAQRGHRLRGGPGEAGTRSSPAVTRRVDVLIVGAGIAGLAAARALMQAGVSDLRLAELEDVAGGNSRGHRMGGIACPLGAHYLPVPGPRDEAVAELLESFGLRRTEAGRPVYDERMLCHSPQERLFIDGQWQDGLLPSAEGDALLLSQYRAFGALIEAQRRDLPYAIPTTAAAWLPAHAVLDAQTFAAWLDTQGITHPKLRWYLDYCCRDDYGAGLAQVSAWAGVHYFASRHGFHAPGDEAEPQEPVLTWPEGNAWLARRLAQPLGDRLQTGWVVERVDEGRQAVDVDLWHATMQRSERWSARQVVLAVPLFVAARVLAAPPAALGEVVPRMRHAPWLVANLQIEAPLADRPGAPLSWDNVLFTIPSDPAGGAALGYVDAMHQSLRPEPGPTVLSAYWALGDGPPEVLRLQRQQLLALPWTAWADRVINHLAQAHPDLLYKLKRIDLMRYGHAMSVPVPGLRGSPALRALAMPQGRLHFAHADLSAYSVFEEAYGHGLRAGAAAAAALRRR